MDGSTPTLRAPDETQVVALDTSVSEGAPLDVKLTRFTSAKGALCKSFEIGGDGKIQKTANANFYDGGAEVISIGDFAELAKLLAELTSHQAIGLGIAPAENVRICTKQSQTEGAIARTKGNFAWPEGQGLVCIDADFDLDKYTPETRPIAEAVLNKIEQQGLRETLSECVGLDLDGVGSLEVMSSSGGVVLPNGEEYPASGRHLYLVIENASDAHRFLRALHDRLWARGYGWLRLTSDGKVLTRSLVDVAVASPERLIFEAKPTVHPPLTYSERRPVVVPGGAFKSEVVTSSYRAKIAVKRAVKRSGKFGLKDVVESISASHEITKGDGTRTTVGELFLEGQDVTDLYDPHEGVSYGHTTAVFYFNDGSSGCRLHSQAHGGRTYKPEFDDAWMAANRDNLSARNLDLVEAYRNSGPSLQRDRKRMPYPNTANVVYQLKRDRKLSGLIGYDEFRKRITLMRDAPWGTKAGTEWSDADTTGLAIKLQADLAPRISSGTVHEAVAFVARDNPFNPLQDYLDGLVWDGKPRVENWLSAYLGVEANAYTRVVGKKWLIGAIARAYEPGCKNDNLLILEGEQGAGKSASLRVLAGGEWFTDHVPDLGNKDAQAQIDGIWIAEISELAAMKGAKSLEKIKAFVTHQVDRYRAPYARNPEDHPRTTVFAGTVNPDGTGYLTDQTGNRRFWPVKVGKVDLPALAADRDQIWAESVQLYIDGEQWWLTAEEQRDLATPEQEERRETDEWEEFICRFLFESPSYPNIEETKIHWTARPKPLRAVTVDEILEDALNLDPAKWSRLDQKRVSKVLKSLGFQKDQSKSWRTKGTEDKYDDRDGQRKWWRLPDDIDIEVLQVNESRPPVM